MLSACGKSALGTKADKGSVFRLSISVGLGVGVKDGSVGVGVGETLGLVGFGVGVGGGGTTMVIVGEGVGSPESGGAAVHADARSAEVARITAILPACCFNVAP